MNALKGGVDQAFVYARDIWWLISFRSDLVGFDSKSGLNQTQVDQKWLFFSEGFAHNMVESTHNSVVHGSYFPFVPAFY